MATIERFEDLEVWKEARELCKIVYSLTNKSPFSKDFDLVRQIRRSSGSTADNIAEGYERDGKKELYNKAISISKMLSGFINYLKKSELKGIKYK